MRKNPQLREMYLGQDTNPSQAVNAARADDDFSDITFSGAFATRTVCMPHFVMATTAGRPAQLDMICCDGAATTSASWARHRCYDIRPCKVGIRSADDDTFFVCTEIGSMDFVVTNEDTGRPCKVTLLDVLISPKFPFHIVSEIKLFEKGCTATKSHGSWKFFTPSGGFLMRASQRLLNTGQGRVNEKLYFIDEHPATETVSDATVAPLKAVRAGTPAAQILSTQHFSERKDSKSESPRRAGPRVTVRAPPRTVKLGVHEDDELPPLRWSSSDSEDSSEDDDTRVAQGRLRVGLTAQRRATQRRSRELHPSRKSKSERIATTSQVMPVAAAVNVKKLSTAKNLQMLLHLHCAFDHRNFEELAGQFGLTLPSPLPPCWTCMLTKPRLITHDKVSTSKPTRPYEVMAADAKGPISTPTPEGYKYFFLIVDMYTRFVWVILARSPKDWEHIWPKFVARIEAKTGKDRCIATL